MNRENRAALAQETLSILEAGGYQNDFGQYVSLATDLKTAVQSSVLYGPVDFADGVTVPSLGGNTETRIEVTSESTLEAARRLTLYAPGGDVLCLNFASAKNPGGGFLGGSQAQEEALARSSGLYPCLVQMTEMYDYNRHRSNGLYSDYMIYSPNVPVFRDEAGQMLDVPYRVSMISAPAVNAGAVRQNTPERVTEIEPTMRQRMSKLLWVAHQHQHRTLILGAWGCGVFGNAPTMVANLFHDFIGRGGKYEGVFDHVAFAIYDRSEGQKTLHAFSETFSLGLAAH